MWTCQKCNTVNWDSDKDCHKCNPKKPPVPREKPKYARTVQFKFRTGDADIGDMGGSKTRQFAKQHMDRARNELNSALGCRDWLETFELIVGPYGTEVMFVIHLTTAAAGITDDQIVETFVKHKQWKKWELE